jgi:hypothetical protein
MDRTELLILGLPWSRTALASIIAEKATSVLAQALAQEAKPKTRKHDAEPRDPQPLAKHTGSGEPSPGILRGDHIGSWPPVCPNRVVSGAKTGATLAAEDDDNLSILTKNI